MTPEQADHELWRIEPAIRYSTELELRRLMASVRATLYEDGRIANVSLTKTGALVIDQSFARHQYERVAES